MKILSMKYFENKANYARDAAKNDFKSRTKLLYSEIRFHICVKIVFILATDVAVCYGKNCKKILNPRGIWCICPPGMYGSLRSCRKTQNTKDSDPESLSFESFARPN